MATSADIQAPSTRYDRNAVLAVMVLAAFGAFLVGHLWDRFPTDFSALFMAAHFYGLGEFGLIYDAPVGFFGNSPPLWNPYLPVLGLEGQPVVPYVYPPLWAALLSPFVDGVDAWTVFRVAAMIKVAALMGSVLVAWRMCQSFGVALWVWVAVSIALLASSTVTLTALYYLQPQIIVTFITLLAFERYAHGASRMAGILLAIAAAMKIAPAGLVLIFLLDRDWRAFGAFVVAGIGLAVLSFGIAGIDLNLAFLDAMAAASAGTLITSINFSITTLIYGLTQDIDWSARNIIIDPPLWIGLVTKAIGVAGLLWAVVATRGFERSQRIALRVILFGLLMNMFGPLGWAHYFLLQLLLLPALLTLLPRVAGGVTIAFTGLLTSWAALMVMRTWLPGDFPVAMVFTSAFIVLFLVTLRKARP